MKLCMTNDDGKVKNLVDPEVTGLRNTSAKVGSIEPTWNEEAA